MRCVAHRHNDHLLGIQVFPGGALNIEATDGRNLVYDVAVFLAISGVDEQIPDRIGTG